MHAAAVEEIADDGQTHRHLIADAMILLQCSGIMLQILLQKLLRPVVERSFVLVEPGLMIKASFCILLAAAAHQCTDEQRMVLLFKLALRELSAMGHFAPVTTRPFSLRQTGRAT